MTEMKSLQDVSGSSGCEFWKVAEGLGRMTAHSGHWSASSV